jgi:hypothetical protein
MKKKTILIPYKKILFILFCTIYCSNEAFCSPPTPPVGLDEPPALGIDLYTIPMVIAGIIFAFYFIKKNTPVQ